MKKINLVYEILKSTKIPSSTEEEMQSFIQNLFLGLEVPFKREHDFSPKDRIDFFLSDFKIGIECKIEGSPLAVKRQIERYLSHSACESIILVTSKFMTMPKQINNKDVLVINVGAGWL